MLIPILLQMYWMSVENPDQLPVDAVLQDPKNHISGMTRNSFNIHSIYSCDNIRRVLLCIVRGSNSNTECARFFKYAEGEPIWIFIPHVYRGYIYDIRVLGEKRSTRELVEHFKLEVHTPFY